MKSIYNSYPDELEDRPKKWAIVTGASEGIGRCVALDLVQCGFNLAIVSRSEAKLEGVKKDLQLMRPKAEVKVFPMDLSHKDLDLSPIQKDE